MVGRLVGSRVQRVEDARLLTGRGTYIDDLRVEGVAHAAFLRSPHAHARLVDIDVTEARHAPGVLAVLTGADIVRLTNPFMGMLTLDGLYNPVFWSLAVDRVRYVGDPVALVVATSRELAEDACELVKVTYDLLVPIASLDDAIDPTRPTIWPGAGSNILYSTANRFGDVDGAFARADRIVRHRLEQHRLSNQPMEARGCLTEVDPLTGAVTHHASTQGVHILRWSLAMLLGARPAWRSVVELARQRARLAVLGRNTRAFFRANRDALTRSSSGTTLPMMRQFVREPRRVVTLTRAVLGLLAKNPAYLHVVAPDVGGAFGAKGLVSREDVAIAAAAVHLGRSVKWTEDRNENLLAGGQAREESLDVEAAVRDDGTVLGLRVALAMDQGAYPGFPIGAPLFARMVQTLFPGPYQIGAFGFDISVVASNKGTYVPYRGPWAAETFARERMFDVIARELELDRAEIRLRNLFDPSDLPHAMVTGPQLDTRMTAKRTLETARQLAELDDWPRIQRAARAEGRCIGLGLATFIEPAPGPPGYMDHVAPGTSLLAVEPSRAILESDGSVTIVSQQVPHGQGHETTLAQIAADELGLRVDDVHVRFGDSRIAPFGMGTGGSRSAKLAGGSVTYASRELRTKVLERAADLLEAAIDDLEIVDGTIHVRGVPSMVLSFADVARAGADGELAARYDYDGAEGGWSCATHVCWVDVDLTTGRVVVPRYLVVEDCGELINPSVVEGQIAGGVVQGIGAVLYERAAYDRDAQFQAGTFMDYLLPTAAEVPAIEIHHVETPSTVEANYRGVGEGGMIAAPAALTSAIEDALAHLGVRVSEQHLPPTRILELAGIL